MLKGIYTDIKNVAFLSVNPFDPSRKQFDLDNEMSLLLTLHESCPLSPAHRKCSTMPPGAEGPYLERQASLVQIRTLTSCSVSGWWPPAVEQCFIRMPVY